MSASLNFITAPNNGQYIVSDLTTGAVNPPYTAKQVQIMALDGTYLFDSGAVSIGQPSFSTTITSDWTTHLGIVQVVVSLIYFQGTNSESLSHTYSLPTSLNIQTT